MQLLERARQTVILALSAFRIVDLFDIAVVAVFVYYGILSLRRTRSRFVVIGIGAFAGVYALARLLDLSMTLMLFQLVLAVAAVGLVVIFQDELRQAFERLGSAKLVSNGLIGRGWIKKGLIRGKPPRLPVTSVPHIARTCEALCRQGIGGLIVFQGRDPLRRHLTAGIKLDGEVSEALLLSIFDTSSPGHDGAVVIRDDKIDSFGVRLPLSETADHSRGTRHAAALGLSERTDALIVVVSEERRTISVAREGSLEPVTPHELELKITGFLGALAPGASLRPGAGSHRRSKLSTQLSAIAISIVAWFVFSAHSTKMATRVVSVPVNYERAHDGWLFEDPSPRELSITVKGLQHKFDGLASTSVKVELAMNTPQEGEQTITVSPNMIDVPEGFVVDAIKPRHVTVVAHRMVKKSVSVTAAMSGVLPEGIRVKSVSTEPGKVTVVVRYVDQQRLVTISTEPIDLSRAPDQTHFKKGLILPQGVRLEDPSDSTVLVTLNLQQTAVVPAEHSEIERP